MRLKTKTLLEERRSSLEEWMTKILSDIDISRCVFSASFLELEVAARSSFKVERLTSESRPSVNSTISSLEAQASAGSSAVAGSSSHASDYGSDTAYEASEMGTEDLSLDEDLSSPIDKFMKYGMSNIDEGLFMGQAILEQLGSFPSNNNIKTKEINNNVIDESMSNGTASKSSYNSSDSQIIRHAKKLSAESVASDINCQREGEMSHSAFPNSFGNTDQLQLVLPSDQRHKMHRILATLKQRLGTSKTDMEDLISRLNQEIAVKDYLTTKVKDLEVELEATKEKSKENLEQAILIERERVTQMQWDMEDLRQKSMEMEYKLKLQQDEINKDSTEVNLYQEKDALRQELAATKLQMEVLMKRYHELEVNSKHDIKVLVKEVKTLRSSQSELKQQLNESSKDKDEIERQYAQEKQSSEQSKTTWKKLLHDCEILQQHFEGCKINLAENVNDLIKNVQSLPDAKELLSTSDDQINLLLAKVQRLDEGEGINSVSSDDTKNVFDIDMMEIIEGARKMLKNVFVSNAKLRKQVNSVVRNAIDTNEVSSHSITEDQQGGNDVKTDELDE
ncbi:unnamed protein product [Cuscuta epithymum]|nr:unnamed protein product [Cuscuta epithymum]